MCALDGVRMLVVSTGASGVVGAGTILEFTTHDGAVSALYTGGRIRIGFLAGVQTGDRIVMRYTQVMTDGQVDGGHCDCRLERMDDGRFRLEEHYTWDSRPGSGVNIFEELP